MGRPSRARLPDWVVAARANTRLAPPCHTRTVPERSAKNSRPSGAKASAVGKLAAMVWAGGSWGATRHDTDDADDDDADVDGPVVVDPAAEAPLQGAATTTVSSERAFPSPV